MFSRKDSTSILSVITSHVVQNKKTKKEAKIKEREKKKETEGRKKEAEKREER